MGAALDIGDGIAVDSTALRQLLLCEVGRATKFCQPLREPL